MHLIYAFIKQKFGGIFPSDGLPTHKANFLYFIVNLDAKHLPGSHWIAIAFKKNVAFYFDSYGNPPTEKNIFRFVKKHSRTTKYNKLRFQSSKTETCGLFTLYFLYQFSRSLPIKHLNAKIINENELFIRQFSKKI